MTDSRFTELEQQIFQTADTRFEELAMEVFRQQYLHNDLYRHYCDSLKRQPGNITRPEQIPFLPIGFFKTHEIKTTAFTAESVFLSSGTTGSIPSAHHVRKNGLYRESFLRCFELFYGKPEQICMPALLPSYLERGNSSLVFMADTLIGRSSYPQSGFYLDEKKKLSEMLAGNESAGVPTLLLGVTYALLDFFEEYPMPLKHTVVMETGGMKGRRREMLREEVHGILKNKTGLSAIHSEYGMTELLSQAYSQKEGLFHTPPWMRVLVRPEDDPLQTALQGNGAINITDLANLYSCAFIATEDAGRVHEDGSFEITGRLDHTDLRGCSLMTETKID